jgi:hypothetical protein
MENTVPNSSTGAAKSPNWSCWRLHGPIIAADRYIQNGTLLIENGIIKKVFDARTEGPEFSVDAGAKKLLILPGLIDLHNHAAYNYFPQWTPPANLMSRFDWRGRNKNGVWINPSADPTYRNEISPFFGKMFEHGCSTDEQMNEREAALIAYGQIRAILGGCTTMPTDCDLDPDHPKSYLKYLGQLTRTEGTEPARRLWAILDIPCIEPETHDPSNYVHRLKKDLHSGQVRPPLRTGAPHRFVLILFDLCRVACSSMLPKV